MPEHSVSANQGQFLFLPAKMCNAQRIIEAGKPGGYSIIWPGRTLGDTGKLVSIGVDPDFATVARANIRNVRPDDRVTVLTGDAPEVLDRLAEEDRKPIDLFFMDTDKPNYADYFQWALKHSRQKISDRS